MVALDSLLNFFSCAQMLFVLASGIVAEFLEQPYDSNILVSLHPDTDGRPGVNAATGSGGGGAGAGGGGRTRSGQEAFRNWMVQSIKKKILQETGRGEHVTNHGRLTTGDTIGHVREVIAFADMPVSSATDNGALEFTVGPNTSLSRHNHFRVDNAAMFVRVSMRRPNGHHTRRQRWAATISVFQLNNAGKPVQFVSGSQEPLPIATVSIRVRSIGWQEVPLPSSVVQDVLESGDPVLRVSFVCENCEVLPSTSRSPAATGSRSGSGSHERRRHGNELPYLTISTSSINAEKK